ncbi:MAG: DUF87 domain-containing protein [Spartobacteria bacterium]|nr:DUF87 domain-containing protein [Spartobacteria bacterium]
MNHNKTIGRVLTIDNFRVYIKIEEELRGAYKSGIDDIYEVARINSYLIIPVGADRVVALITRVTMKEEIDFEKTSTSIKLPASSRYVSATMLGTITKENGNEKFVQGVYNFPTLDNPVWYVTKADLKQIFDDKGASEKIDYRKDYYLPVGQSPAFSGYKVKICPDQFFVKHAAILGNTGSGKSCTLASIIRNIFRFNYNDNKILENAHFVVLDTNGEYKDAFLPQPEASLDEKTQKELQQINAYYYGGDKHVKVPYWFMNWSEFRYLFRPGEGSQSPVLNRAIGLAKNETLISSGEDEFGILELEHLAVLSEIAKAGDWWKAGSLKDSYNSFKGMLPAELQGLSFEKNAPCPIPDTIKKMDGFIESRRIEKSKNQAVVDQNIDLPTWFNYQELCKKFIDAAIAQESTGNNRITELLSTLRLRMNSFLNDKRMAIPLMLKDGNDQNKTILSRFIAFILGDFNRLFKDDENGDFIEEYNRAIDVYDKDRTSQLTIVDVSQLPFEVLETVTALLGRLIIEFVSHFMPENRGKYPIVIVLEEAQNYIAEKSESIAKTVFERIAREGRKYGISLVVCSQRPSELSKTVLSQCNSFVIHRLQNPDDQKYIQGLVSSASADILEQLPIIPQQHAVITGDCVRTPIQVKIDDVNPTPNSHNPAYIGRWLENSPIPYKDTCNKWLGRQTDTADQEVNAATNKEDL